MWSSLRLGGNYDPYKSFETDEKLNAAFDSVPLQASSISQCRCLLHQGKTDSQK